MSDSQLHNLASLRVLVVPDDGPLVSQDPHLSDLVGEAFSADAQMVAIPLARLGPDFLALKTGVAGHVLQKLVNYRFRIAILGDTHEAAESSGPLRDFIGESNRGTTVWFVGDLAALEAKVHKPG